MRTIRTAVALAALLAASPAGAWCGNTATNCGAPAPLVHYEPPTLEHKVREAQED
jgi:hypothetical protein